MKAFDDYYTIRGSRIMTKAPFYFIYFYPFKIHEENKNEGI